MKKIVLILSSIFLWTYAINTLDAQVIWQEDFESYIPDSTLETQSSEWVGWGNAITSTLVTEDTAASGTQSMKIWNGSAAGSSTALSDVLHLFGDSTTGRYMLKFKVFVPSLANGLGAGTYYNIQHSVDANNNGTQWAMEIYLRQPGAQSTITVGGIAYPIPTVHDKWIDVIHIFDLDRDMHDYFYNDQWITSNPFSFTNSASSGLNQLSAIDIYAACGSTSCTELGYFDDFEFKHFKDPNNDAGILSMNSANYCPGSPSPIDITVKNWGFNDIDTLAINWSIDGVAQTPVNYYTTIVPGGQANISLGTPSFGTASSYDLKFWTSNPNQVLDTVNFNDTLESKIGPSIQGNLTIDASIPAGSGNYQSFADLEEALNSFGVCGPVYVTVAPGTYNDNLLLQNITGSSSTNTITIDGVDASLVTLTNDGSNAYATLALDNVNYVTVKNMTIESTNSTAGTAVLIGSNTAYNVIDSNIIIADISSTSTNVNAVAFSGNIIASNYTTPNSNYNTISNNKISGGYYGIRAYGTSASVGINNKILNNEVSQSYYYGAYVYYQDSLEIIGNSFDVNRNATTYGVAIYYTTNSIVNRNLIRSKGVSTGYGIYYYEYAVNSTPTRKPEFSNNMIDAKTYGMYIYYADSVDLYHNTIVAGSYAAYITHSAAPYMSNYDVRNNIFVSTSSYALYTNQPDTMFFKLESNLYHTLGTNLLNIGGTVYSTLALYQAAAPTFNTTSVQGDPGFFNINDDLHLIGTLANDAGDNSVGITVDIDGDTRPIGMSTTVDIGADEYDVPTCMPVFNLRAFDPTLDSITIVWDGVGTDFEYEIVEEGQALGTGLSGVVTSDSIRIGGLSASTNYKLYVREICTRGDTSMRRPSEFSTADTLDYFEDFEDFKSGLPSNGWTYSSIADPLWLVGASGSNSYNPLIDHTVGAGGKFAHYTGVYAGTEDLISIPIYTDTNDIMELSFWYHNAGSLSSMNVYVDTNGTSNLIAHIPGNQQADRDFPWKKFSTYIKGYSNQFVTIRFEGTHIFGYDKEVAVDDVSLKTVPAFEAALVELIQPTGAICAGTVTPVVGVMNVGQTDIDSVMVYWDINGTLDSLMYSNTILSGDTAQVALGNINFNSTTAYDIKFYIKNPNSSTDPNAANDTLRLDGLRTGMAGNYTIDPSAPVSSTNFVDFQSIISNLTTYGVCGSVYVTVANGTYSDAVYLSEIPGVSAVDTVVFDGTDSSLTIINQSAQYATWTFDGAKHVTLKNLSIENSGTNSAVVLFANEANYNTITNSELNANISSTSSLISNIVFSASTTTRSNGAKTHFNTIANNKVNGGYYGLYQYGPSSGDLPKGIQILNNEFKNQYYYGIYLYYSDSMDIVGNNIDMTDRNVANAYGAYVYFSFNIKFNENYVHSGGNCLQYLEANGIVYQSRPHEYNNNMLISDNGNGLYLYLNMWGPQAYAKVHHTSISANGSQPAILSNLYSTPIDFDIRNSILNSASGTAMTISNQSPAVFSEMDHNIYNTNGGSLFSFNGITFSDLSSLQSAYPMLNANALEGDPQYEDPTSDLHIINGTFANDVGDNSVNILFDIDGDSRPIGTSTVVDIGADEFDPPTCPLLLNLGASNASPDSITLSWNGLGGNEFQIEIVEFGDPQGSGDTLISITDAYRAGGLAPYTEYEFYVREICSRGDTSIWAGPFKFRTDSIFNDVELNSLTAPVARTQSCYSSTEDVEVLLINNGNMPIDFVTDNFNVYVDVTGAVAQSYSVLLDDNSLNSNLPLAIGDSLTVYMGTLDMTSAGNYDFKAYIGSNLDVASSNDTINSQIVNATSGGTLDLLANVCGSGIVDLSTSGSVGDVQWQRLVGSAFIDEASADSVAYEVFVDSTVSFRVVACGTEISDTLVITPNVVPAAPTTFNDTAIVFCGDSGTAVLNATTVITGIEFNWYTDSSKSLLLASGSSYNFGLNTAIQTVTTYYTDTFYVSVLDTATDCESELSMVSGTVICTVGEKEMPSTLSGISIYPNPSQGVFNLIGNNVEEVLDVTIFNSNGKAVYKMDNKVSNNFNEQIDLSGLAKGMYFIKFQGEKSMEMRKVVIH